MCQAEPLEILRTEDGLSSNSIQVLHVDARGALWVGTNGGGITVVDGTTRRHIRVAQGLSSDFVTSLHESVDGAVWVGTYGGGLNRIRGDSICTVTTREGLFDNVIFDLHRGQSARPPLVDELGARHLQHSRSRRCTRRARGAARASAGRLYSVTEGGRLIEGSSGQQPLGWFMRDGRLWFATQLGVLVIDPRDVGPLPPAPHVLVERVTVDGVDAPAGRAYRARWEGGAVRFTWTAPTFRSAPIRFRYQLEDFDPEWIEAGTSRLASYTNLPPGDYVFRVQSDDGEGTWGRQDTRYALSARAAVLSDACGSTWAWRAGARRTCTFVAYRVRVRQLRAREHGLTALVERADARAPARDDRARARRRGAARARPPHAGRAASREPRRARGRHRARLQQPARRHPRPGRARAERPAARLARAPRRWRRSSAPRRAPPS